MTDAKQRLAQCEEARLRVLRGDGMIGIMPVEEIQQMVAGYRALGKEGNADAWLGLAQYHLDENGLDYSPASAAEGAGAAVALGSVPARSILRASVVQLRAEGDEDPANASSAFAALEAASDDDDAAYHAGLLAYHGYGTPKSAEASLRFHEMAANKGHAAAMFELYVLNATGQGTAKDEAKALAWCKQAGERGMARAAFNMGAFYATGQGGVELDEAKALEWYGKASAAGHGKATATLAYMTAIGEGCETNEERAEELFELAEEQGFDVETFRDQVGV